MEYEMCEQGIENLVTGIVTQAAKDYRKVRHLENSYEKRELEEFFLSTWFHQLTGLDGQMVLDKLKAGN